MEVVRVKRRGKSGPSNQGRSNITNAFDVSDSDDELGSDETSRAHFIPPIKLVAKPMVKPKTIAKPPSKRKSTQPPKTSGHQAQHEPLQISELPKPTISDMALDTLKQALKFADAADAAIRNRPVGKDQIWDVEPEPIINETLAGFKMAKRREEEEEFASEGIDGLTDESLYELAPYTDELGVNDFNGYLRFIPRLVNVVTLAETRPVTGSKTTFPLDLNAIAAKCSSSFFSPRKFSACQLAFAFPRSRILIFHTGRLVGTGAGGAVAARTSILKTLVQLRDEADIHLELVDFVIINQVGAVDLRASLSCDAFASAHTSTAHYDRSSFVGLAWRASGETICCEIYGTGRANLPGSVALADLFSSFARMVCELLRFSSSPHLNTCLRPELANFHRAVDTVHSVERSLGVARRVLQQKQERQAEKERAKQPKKASKGLFDGWTVGKALGVDLGETGREADASDFLTELGL